MNKEDDVNDKTDRNDSAEDHVARDGSDDGSPVPPTLIGWGLRIVSLLLIGALMIYLLIRATSPETDFALTVEPDWSKASDRDGELLVPIDLTNDSTQTVRNLKVDLMSDTPDPVEVEVELFGPGETVTYVIPLKERGEVSHRVLSFEQ